jgi:hypothetical protein
VSFVPRARVARWLSVGALAALASALALTRVQVSGAWYGLYLLHGTGAAPLELTDDLLLGEGNRVIAGVSFSRVREVAQSGDRLSGGEAWLESEWDAALGRGIVRNHFPDGTELVTLLSRYHNGGDDGEDRHGAFLGGSIPDVALDVSLQNQSGMAYRDAQGRWFHIWCNANEAIWDVADGKEIDTWAYRYVGSHVVVRDAHRMVIESEHEILVSGVPLRMTRVAQFTAGAPYVLLGVTLENVGTSPARFMFLYGDEPWVGDFGVAYGNLGWTSDGIFADEALLEHVQHRWAGIVDTKSGKANFLAWPGNELPTKVYVSNELGKLVPGVPLASGEIFIGTEWHWELAPGESRHLLLAVGMAVRDPTGRLTVPSGLFARRAP